MGNASIGIKLADGKFFPVLDEGSPASKILEVSTVRDNQSSVQINLFRAEDGSAVWVDDSPGVKYVGTLIIEDIAEKPAGYPTISLTLTLSESNELSAEAVDVDTGSRQVLNVSLETLEMPNVYAMPDFDLVPNDSDIALGEDPDHENVVVEGTIPGNAPEGLFEMNRDEERKNGIFMPAWLCILILAVGVIALVLAMIVYARVLVMSSSVSDRQAVAPPVVEAPVVPAVEPAPVPEPVPEVVTPPPVEVVEEAPIAVVVEEPVVVPVQPEPVEEAKDIRYKIKWGDTLWDIADSYYRNPWLYPRIAKHNNIKNPNLIISGTYIDIPAK